MQTLPTSSKNSEIKVFDITIDKIIRNLKGSRKQLNKFIEEEQYRQAEELYSAIQQYQKHITESYLKLSFPDDIVRTAYKILNKR